MKKKIDMDDNIKIISDGLLPEVISSEIIPQAKVFK